MNVSFATNWFAAHREQILGEYFDLLRIPTIGASPKHLGDCAHAAAWLKKWLAPLGFEVEIVTPPSGAVPVPVLLAERRGDGPSGRTVLFYGHYDVQPEDPVAEWKTPPFEPTLLGDRVYCRGAQDDKGQFFSALQGLAAAIRTKKALPTIRLVLEGQEESGSNSLMDLAQALKDRLTADVLLVCDTSSGPENRPAIVAGLRGVAHFTLTLTGPDHDLHSGHHGGIAPNPCLGMAQLLTSLHNPDGSIAVKGFLNGIREPSEEERGYALANDETPEAYAKETGCPPSGGRAELPVAVRRSFLPSIDVNGIHGGYGGPGSKTVIASSCLAKLSFRMVPDQSPAACLDALKKHFEKHCPAGLQVALTEVSGGAPGFRLPLHSPVFRLATEELTAIDPRGPVFQWEGASIPVVSELCRVSGAAPLLVGWGRESDRIHCPNESYGLDQFVESMEWAGRIFPALA